jgi:hypothetical protein
MGISEGTQLHAQPVHESFAESVEYRVSNFVTITFLEPRIKIPVITKMLTENSVQRS